MRPVRPGDEALIESFHGRQSPESIYFRYFSPRPTLSSRDLAHLTNVDYVDRMAFIGLLGDDLIGIARYDRYPTSGTAEVAFFTDDEHQGRGMATVLLEYLAAAAREAGLTGFVAQVLPQNSKMLSVFKQAGFEVHSRFEDGVIEVELGIEPTEEARERIEQRSRAAFARSIRRLLAPTSIAVIGASRTKEAIGHQAFARLLRGDFQGPVYPVNPVARSVASVRAYASVLDIPDEVDLAVVCVPAAQIRAVVTDCARKHVRGLTIMSAGFSESGPAGSTLEREIVELAHRHGMRIIGPNSMGVINTSSEVSMHATFVGESALPGRIGVSSQSGTLGAAIVGHARRLGLGISTFVSLGNTADVSSNDLLQYWEEDPETDLVLLHLESFGNPHNFARITRHLTRNKPVVAVKSSRAIRLAELPDGLPLAASLDALLSETGIIRVDTLEQLFDVAVLLSHQPIARGRRVAIVSNSWGPAMLAADAAVGAGLVLAELSNGDGRANPIDLGYAAGVDEFRGALRAVLQDEGVDGVLVLCTPPVASDLDRFAAAIGKEASSSQIPVVASYLGLTPAFSESAPRTVPVFEFPEAAVHALGRVARYGEWLARDPGELPEPEMVDQGSIRRVIDELLTSCPTDGWLSPEVGADVLAATGIPIVERALAADESEAVEAGRDIGWPVAIKATGVARPAKTEAGGVAVDIHDAEEFRSAYRRMNEMLGEAMHPAMVQAMAPPGVDVRIALYHHTEVGSVVTLSVDRTYEPVQSGAMLQVVPFSDTDARRLVEASGLADILRAAQATGAVDDADSADRAIGHVVEVLLRLSLLAEAAPEVKSLILDPVLVSEDGAWTIDVRIRLGPAEPRGGPAVRRLDSDQETGT